MSGIQRLRVTPSHAPAPSREYSAAVISRDPRVRRAVKRVLHAAGLKVQAAADNTGITDDFNLLVFDLDGDPLEEQALAKVLEAKPPVAMILIARKTDADYLAQLFKRSYCKNLIGIAEDADLTSTHFMVTTGKLLDADIFGVDKYLRWGALVQTIEIADSSQKDAAMKHFETFLRALECRHRIVSEALTVADEFILNALYDAPFDHRVHRHLYADQPRTQPVTLPPGAHIQFSFGSDGRFVAIGCRDPFGSIDPEAVLRSLSRGFQRGDDQVVHGTGGAGIGLYMSFNFVDHMVVNVDHGRATEFIGVVDLRPVGRVRGDRPHSLNIFVRDPQLQPASA